MEGGGGRPEGDANEYGRFALIVIVITLIIIDWNSITSIHTFIIICMHGIEWHMQIRQEYI